MLGYGLLQLLGLHRELLWRGRLDIQHRNGYLLGDRLQRGGYRFEWFGHGERRRSAFGVGLQLESDYRDERQQLVPGLEHQ